MNLKWRSIEFLKINYKALSYLLMEYFTPSGNDLPTWPWHVACQQWCFLKKHWKLAP